MCKSHRGRFRKKKLTDQKENSLLTWEHETDRTGSWNACHVKGKFERVEIRPDILGCAACVILVSLPGIPTGMWVDPKRYTPVGQATEVQISMNGKMPLTYEQMAQMNEAIQEAKRFLENKKRGRDS